jgi:hypothetical protein
MAAIALDSHDAPLAVSVDFTATRLRRLVRANAILPVRHRFSGGQASCFFYRASLHYIHTTTFLSSSSLVVHVHTVDIRVSVRVFISPILCTSLEALLHFVHHMTFDTRMPCAS